MLVGPGTCSDKVSLGMCYQPVLNVNNLIVVVWVDTMSGCAPEYNFCALLPIQVEWRLDHIIGTSMSVKYNFFFMVVHTFIWYMCYMCYALIEHTHYAIW